MQPASRIQCKWPFSAVLWSMGPVGGEKAFEKISVRGSVLWRLACMKVRLCHKSKVFLTSMLATLLPLFHSKKQVCDRLPSWKPPLVCQSREVLTMSVQSRAVFERFLFLSEKSIKIMVKLLYPNCRLLCNLNCRLGQEVKCLSAQLACDVNVPAAHHAQLFWLMGRC